MSFITYAQNNEDLVLYRALSEVQNGFYIDVGANDPSDDSVTKAFYDRGWRGINIEPLLSHWTDLERDRPEDINIRCAVGDHSGVMEIWEPEIRGWSTASVDVIAQHESDGLVGVTHSVPMRTLTEICQENGNREIHFLKIDVEGFERNVLLGMDFQKFRPWIIVVEAFDPVTKTENFETWESLLTSAQYLLSYADGLNRFYVAAEHEMLAERMKYPPNVFDDFIRVREVVSTHRAEKSECLSSELEEKNSALHTQYENLEALNCSLKKLNTASEERYTALADRYEQLTANYSNQLNELEYERQRVAEFSGKAHEWWTQALMLEERLGSMTQSWSWKITFPLRVALGFIKNPISYSRKAINYLIARGMNTFATPLSKLIKHVLGKRNSSEKLNFWLQKKYPSLHSHLKAIAIKNGVIPADAPRKNLSLGVGGGTATEYADLALLGVYPKYPKIPQAMLFAETALEKKRWVRLTGHLEGYYSLAIVNRNLVAALEKVNGERVKFIPYHGSAYEKLPELPLDQLSALGGALRRNLSSVDSSDVISLTHHYPLIVDEQAAGAKTCLFFWEETSVPVEIIEKLNESFDGVFVAAESVKNALINSGCRTPVVVVPIGIDHLISSDTEPVRNLTVSKTDQFRFLHVSSAFDRKGVDVLLDAYLEAFSSDDHVELFIKTFSNPHNRVHDQLAERLAKYAKPARVVIDDSPLDDAGMVSLYRTAHAVVLPTRGEGFNLPAAEALAMGIPVLTTGYSAQIDFCTMSTAELIAYKFAASESHVKADDACWVNPDKDDLVRVLKRVRERVLCGDSQLELTRLNSIEYVRNTYSWENAAKSVIKSMDYFDAIQSASDKQLRFAMLTPWNAQCGIAEYSEKLFKKHLSNNVISAEIYADSRTRIADSNTTISWRVGDTESVVRTLDRIATAPQVDVVVVQHQPSLFELTGELCERLARLQNGGKGVYLELHSTQSLMGEFRLTRQAVGYLRQVERIIVHKVEDLNNLLSLGLWENVVLLKHGVIQPLSDVDSEAIRKSLNIPVDALVLGCFGFALPHKGLDAIVDALPLIANQIDRPVHMLAVCSALDERSNHVIHQCKALAERLGVSRNITWITDYRPISECQELLTSADYIIFPYRDTQESASGAVTIGLSTLKPVLVSPLNIFSDVQDVTVQMSGSQAVDISNAVVKCESKLHGHAARMEVQRQWLKIRNWDSVTDRLVSMITVLQRETELRNSIRFTSEDGVARCNLDSNKRIYVDISELYVRDGKSGIQRVVRNILREMQLEPPEGYSVYPVYGVKGKGFFYTSKFDAPVDASEGAPLFVSVDDVFLGLDLAAHLFPEAESNLLEMKRAGAKIYYVIYDIIPLLHSEYAFPGIEGAFEEWMHGLNSFADGVLCISKSVSKDLNEWFQKNGGKRVGLNIEYFHLGADFTEMQDFSYPDSNSLKVLPHPRNEVRFLMVGTLEPRKGHAQVLDAFDLLWQAGVSADLVIVGKVGWNVESLVARIKSNTQFNIHLFWFDKLDDYELTKIYRDSSCLIAASYAEGFGLPLIEAAQYGRPIIARDIPVFREVAGVGAFFFSCQDAAGLARCIQDWLLLFEKNVQPDSKSIKRITWNESTKFLLRKIVK